MLSLWTCPGTSRHSHLSCTSMHMWEVSQGGEERGEEIVCHAAKCLDMLRQKCWLTFGKAVSHACD